MERRAKSHIPARAVKEKSRWRGFRAERPLRYMDVVHGVLFLLLSLCAASAAAESLNTEAAGMRFVVPRNWDRVPAPSDARAAQYRIPRAAGDAEAGELVLFFFGRGKGGSAEDNLARWYGQFAD